MSNLVSFGDDRIPRANTISLAEAIGKTHSIVLRDIKELPMPDDFRAKHFRSASNKGLEFTEEGFAYISQLFRSRQANEAKILFLSEFARLRQAAGKYRDEDIVEVLSWAWHDVYIAKQVAKGEWQADQVAHLIQGFDKTQAKLVTLGACPA